MASEKNRHEQRLERVQALFSWDFQPGEQSHHFALIADIVSHLDELDAIILHFAPKRDLAQFDKVGLAILRQALYELKYTRTPPAVVIDEAINLGKLLADESAAGFIHGVLATYLDDLRKGPAREP